MRTIAVVVVDELGQNLVQVGLADGNHVVKALLTDCPDPALGDRVGAGRPKRSPQTPDIDRECALAEGGAPDTVTVVDQISRLAAQGVASISCLQTQAAVGWAVTSKWTSWRRP